MEGSTKIEATFLPMSSSGSYPSIRFNEVEMYLKFPLRSESAMISDWFFDHGAESAGIVLWASSASLRAVHCLMALMSSANWLFASPPFLI